MSETYVKVDDKLEITTTHTRLVSALELLQEKERMQHQLVKAEREVTSIKAQLDELDNKLKIIKG